VNLVRTPTQTIGTSDEENVANEGGGIIVPAVVGVLLVGLVIGATLFYRKQDGEGVKSFVEDGAFDAPPSDDEFASAVGHDVEAAVPAESYPASNESTEPLSTPESVGPTPETPPTSVDEHGYEWYTSEAGHWYRTAGSAEAWTPYQA